MNLIKLGFKGDVVYALVDDVKFVKIISNDSEFDDNVF